MTVTKMLVHIISGLLIAVSVRLVMFFILDKTAKEEIDSADTSQFSVKFPRAYPIVLLILVFVMIMFQTVMGVLDTQGLIRTTGSRIPFDVFCFVFECVGLFYA